MVVGRGAPPVVHSVPRAVHHAGWAGHECGVLLERRESWGGLADATPVTVHAYPLRGPFQPRRRRARRRGRRRASSRGSCGGQRARAGAGGGKPRCAAGLRDCRGCPQRPHHRTRSHGGWAGGAGRGWRERGEYCARKVRDVVAFLFSPLPPLSAPLDELRRRLCKEERRRRLFKEERRSPTAESLSAPLGVLADRRAAEEAVQGGAKEPARGWRPSWPRAAASRSITASRQRYSRYEVGVGDGGPWAGQALHPLPAPAPAPRAALQGGGGRWGWRRGWLHRACDPCARHGGQPKGQKNHATDPLPPPPAPHNPPQHTHSAPTSPTSHRARPVLGPEGQGVRADHRWGAVRRSLVVLVGGGGEGAS
jgi:hypothetical protein